MPPLGALQRWCALSTPPRIPHFLQACGWAWSRTRGWWCRKRARSSTVSWPRAPSLRTGNASSPRFPSASWGGKDLAADPQTPPCPLTTAAAAAPAPCYVLRATLMCRLVSLGGVVVVRKGHISNECHSAGVDPMKVFSTPRYQLSKSSRFVLLPISGIVSCPHMFVGLVKGICVTFWDRRKAHLISSSSQKKMSTFY